MDLSNRVLGSHVVKQMQAKHATPLLRIGRDTFLRRDLARVECFNFLAAANLSSILNKELQVKDTRDVFDTIDPSALALPHIGSIAIAVLGAAFEAKGIGGDAPLENWVRKHTSSHKLADIVTFSSYKTSAFRRDHPTPSTKGRNGHKRSK